MEKYQINEIEVKYKANLKDSPVINNSRDMANLMREIFPVDEIGMKEFFYIILLNRGGKILGMKRISEGGITGTVADPRIIYGIAVKSLAVGMIVAHNHPSGNLKPSRADEDLTEKLVGAGKFLDIKVMDHIILSGVSEEYFSFADEGLI